MNQEELKLQAQCFQWHWNTYPEERYLLHANNNNSVNAIKGNQNRSIGVVAGVADMEYYRGGKVVFIELKHGNGRQSDKQIKFQKRVEAEGIRYAIVRTLEEFQKLIHEIQLESSDITQVNTNERNIN